MIETHKTSNWQLKVILILYFILICALSVLKQRLPTIQQSVLAASSVHKCPQSNTAMVFHVMNYSDVYIWCLDGCASDRNQW
jgi:hypothetical protein